MVKTDIESEASNLYVHCSTRQVGKNSMHMDSLHLYSPNLLCKVRRVDLTQHSL